MDKKQVNKIIYKTKNRTERITVLVLIVIILAITSFTTIFISLRNQVNYYIHYDEKSDLDYKVYLKDNDYFGEYLGKDKQYIASLIDHIQADFNYKLSIDEKIDYSYYYFIDAEVQVLDSNGKALYQKTDEMIKKQSFDNPKDYTFNINKSVDLDYNYYNNIVNTFIKKYGLSNVKSQVILKMYVGINGDCKEFESSLSDNAVISMTVPLTTNTVNIDMNYVLNNGTNKLLECRKTSFFDNHGLVIGIGLGILTILILLLTIKYSYKTRSTLTIYNKKLKSIFNNYGQYISKIKSEIKYEKYQVVFVEEFEDLFEVRNSSGSPILFFQDESNIKSAFIVPTNSGLVYIYYFSLASIYLKDKYEKK